MAKGPSPTDAAPDLFSRAAGRDESPLTVSGERVAPQLPHLLPKDLPGAVRRLVDQELEKLFSTVSTEMRRRKLVPDQAPVQAGTPASQELQRQRGTVTTAKALKTPGPLPVTQAKLNAIRAAVKAGVKPNTIARQFGVSLSAIRRAVDPAKS
jgi:hypothetical protein